MYANSASCDHYDDDDGHGRPWQALTAAAAALATSCTTRAGNQSTISATAAAAAAILVAAEAAAAAATAAQLRAEVLGRRRWSTGDVRYVTATSAVVTYREASFIVYSVFQNIMHPAFATSD